MKTIVLFVLLCTSLGIYGQDNNRTVQDTITYQQLPGHLKDNVASKLNLLLEKDSFEQQYRFLDGNKKMICMYRMFIKDEKKLIIIFNQVEEGYNAMDTPLAPDKVGKAVVLYLCGDPGHKPKHTETTRAKMEKLKKKQRCKNNITIMIIK